MKDEHDIESQFIAEKGAALHAWGKVVRGLEEFLRLAFFNRFSSDRTAKVIFMVLAEKQKIHLFYTISKKKNSPLFSFCDAERLRAVKILLDKALEARNDISHSRKSLHVFNLRNLKRLRKNRRNIERAAALLRKVNACADKTKNAAPGQHSLF